MTESPRPASRTRRYIRNGCLSMIALTLGCAVVGSLIDGDTAGTVQQTPVPVIGEAVTSPPIEPTAAPTVAPEPTAIVVPTLALDPTTAPGLSDATRAYFAAAAGPLGEYGKWMVRLGEQSEEAGKDASLILDDAWKVDTAVALAGMSEAAAQLDALDATGTEAEEIGRLMQLVVDETGPAISEYTEGVDNFDVTAINSAAARLRKINGWMSDVMGELRRLGLTP